MSSRCFGSEEGKNELKLEKNQPGFSSSESASGKKSPKMNCGLLSLLKFHVMGSFQFSKRTYAVIKSTMYLLVSPVRNDFSTELI